MAMQKLSVTRWRAQERETERKREAVTVARKETLRLSGRDAVLGDPPQLIHPRLWKSRPFFFSSGDGRLLH